MTMKERLKVHKEIVDSNARKQQDWKEYPHTWREQVETRLVNLEIAKEAMRDMEEMGVFG